MTARHASPTWIAAYIRGSLPADAAWAVESHLEDCAQCRRKIAAEASTIAPEVAAIVEGTWDRLADAIDNARAPARPRRARWLATWAPPALIPWLTMTTVVVLLAIVADALGALPGHTSALLLVAPAVPVLAVALSWTRTADPAFDLVAATPRAGLYLVLRRTVAALVASIPVLLVGGCVTGTTPATWVLPSLGLTSCTLALGGLFGLARAGFGLILAWVALVVGPSLFDIKVSVVFGANGVAAWTVAIGLSLAATAVIAVHGDYARTAVT